MKRKGKTKAISKNVSSFSDAAWEPKVVLRPHLIERLNEGLSACDKPEGIPKKSRLDYGNDAPLVQ
jgi:hypothetical protein